MNTSTWGRFGVHVYRRDEPDGIWLGGSAVHWLGIAMMQIGRWNLTITWPVRFAA